MTIDHLINLSFLRHFGKPFFLELINPNSSSFSYPWPTCLYYTMMRQFQLHFLHLHKDTSWDISGLLVNKILAQQSLLRQRLCSHFFCVGKLKSAQSEIVTIRDSHIQFHNMRYSCYNFALNEYRRLSHRAFTSGVPSKNLSQLILG